MTYAAAVAPRRASVTRQEKENVPAAVARTDAAVSEITKDEFKVGQSIAQPTPRPVGRARSNSFYGQVQHTVLARRRSPPPPPSLAVVSDNTSNSSCATSTSKSAYVLTPQQSGLRACAARLDLCLGFAGTSTTSLVSGAVNAVLAASSSTTTYVTPAATCVQISVSTSTTETTTSAADVLSCSSSSSLASLSSPFSSSALHTLRTLTSSPLPPARTLAPRDSRSKLVAGLLLNRTKGKPLAAARQRRRTLWGCSAASRGEGGVFAGSSLRSELVF